MNDSHRPAPRSASVLKTRVLAAHRAEIDAGLAWLATDRSVESAAAAITRARRRFVLGAATSFTYASLLAAKLSSALAQVTLVDGTIVRPLEILSDVRDSDVLIAISLYHYRTYTIENARSFAEAGGALVVITDAPTNPLVGVAAVAVVLEPTLDRRGENDITAKDLRMHPETPRVSPTVLALVIDTISTLSAASAKGARRRLAERERLGTRLGLYTESVDPGSDSSDHPG